MEASTGLFSSPDGVKTYEQAGALGLRFGANLFRFIESDEIELVLSAGNTLGNSDYQFFFTDGGLRWNFWKKRSAFALSYALGVRHYEG